MDNGGAVRRTQSDTRMSYESNTDSDSGRKREGEEDVAFQEDKLPKDLNQ